MIILTTCLTWSRHLSQWSSSESQSPSMPRVVSRLALAALVLLLPLPSPTHLSHALPHHSHRVSTQLLPAGASGGLGGRLFDGLCAMWKNYPAFQIGRVSASSGGVTPVANLTGVDVISEGVCVFDSRIFVTASDDLWQENQLFVVALLDGHYAADGGSLRILNISHMGRPYGGKVQIEQLLGLNPSTISESNAVGEGGEAEILGLIGHDTEPSNAASGDTWSDVLACMRRWVSGQMECVFS